MEYYLPVFKNYLFSQKASALTVKNYYSDIRHFIRWYEMSYKTEFLARQISANTIKQYEKDLTADPENPNKRLQMCLSASSMARHLSSLNRYFNFLKQQGTITQSPFESLTSDDKQSFIKENQKSRNSISAFKDYLFRHNCSGKTIKNYLSDIKQFALWLDKTTDSETSGPFYQKITTELIEAYKNRLLSDAGYSALSVNRKLSSIRKYLTWLNQTGLLNQTQKVSLDKISNISNHLTEEANFDFNSLDQPNHTPEITEEFYTNTGFLLSPLRVYKRITSLISSLVDLAIVAPIAKTAEHCQYILLKLGKKKLFNPFIPATKQYTSAYSDIDSIIVQGVAQNKKEIDVQLGLTSFANISKSFYAPLNISTSHMKLHQKAWHNLRHKRPEWYKRYHEYSVVHYLHFSLLLIYIAGLAVAIQNYYFNTPGQPLTAFAAYSTSPPRMLTFKGRLTDNQNTPITAISKLRFSLYNSPFAGGASLLWKDTQNIKPDGQGYFLANLGENTPLPQDILNQNPRLYLGISVNDQTEMKPRQPIASAGLAEDSQSVQGLKPITYTGDSANTILALDSTGNLTMNGISGHAFRATEGNFSLTGDGLIFSTNPGSDSDVVLMPDGTGKIDLQKPLFNSTVNNNLANALGSVEIDDTFSIMASSSSVAALTIEQQSGGPIISASASGAVRFSVDFMGNTYLGGDLALSGNNLLTSQNAFNLLPENVINLNIGNSATELRIGANSGNTLIRNNLVINGNSSLGNDLSDTVYFNGRLGSDILPAESNRFNLGSAELALNNAYLNNLFLTPQATTSGFLTKDKNNISFINKDDSLLIGRDSNNNPLIKLGGLSGNDSYLNSGKVGIATTSALTDTLQVYGDIRIGTAQSSGCLKNIDGTALVGQCSSDLRLKKNINPISNVLEKLTKLQPVTFMMRDDEYPQYGFGQTESFGLIAQDVEVVFPQLVSTDSWGYKTVNYGTALTMLNIQAVKELDNRLNALQSQSLGFNYTGDLSINDGSYDVILPDGQTATNLGSFAKAWIGVLSTGITKAKEGIFDSLAVSSDKLTIAGISLNEYIKNTLQKSALNNEISISSPLISADQLKTNYISPISNDSQISIELGNSVFSIKDQASASGNVVASIDRNGNATFSGRLQTGSLSSSDASISGTLRAKSIIADNIAGLDDKLASLSADLSRNLNERFNLNSASSSPNISNAYSNASNSALSNEQISTSSALLTDIQTGTQSAAFNNLSGNSLITTFTPLGSSAAALAYVPDLQADNLSITGSINSLGQSNFSDLSITNQLSVGANFILTDASVNVLGESLKLQPLRQGALEIMAGLVEIDTDGNLSVSGNALFAKDVTIKGELQTNIIAPVPGSDLVIKLPGNKQNEANDIVNNASLALNQAANNTGIVVKNSEGSNILAINNLGDLVASGTAAFKDIAAGSLNIIRGAQADTSAIETVASGSAGVSAITKGYTSRTIYSPYVQSDSLIYITPRSETTLAVPYLSRQTPENTLTGIKGSFTVQIPNVVTENIEFNWWIIN